MSAMLIDRTISELQQDGYESWFSYHIRIPEQWHMACAKAEEGSENGAYEVVRVKGQDEAELSDGVEYLYRRRIE